MVDCDNIDLSKILGPDEFTSEESEHIQSCPKCKTELDEIKTMSNAFQSYFHLADNAHCPFEKDIPRLIWPPDGTPDKQLEAHMNQCPVCTRAYMELKAFDQEFEEPADISPLPESLQKAVNAYRRRASAARTRKVLEKFASQTKKGREWMDEVIKNTFTDKAAHPAPAAREDLTHSKKEAEQKKQDETEPESDEKDDK